MLEGMSATPILALRALRHAEQVRRQWQALECQSAGILRHAARVGSREPSKCAIGLCSCLRISDIHLVAAEAGADYVDDFVTRKRPGGGPVRRVDLPADVDFRSARSTVL